MFNDLAWLTFTSQVPYLIAQSVLLAVAVFFDDQRRPVFPKWVAYFNLLTAAAFVPAAFVGLATDGPLAWNGALSFWLKNITIAVWIIVMTIALAQAIFAERAHAEPPREPVPA